MAKFSIKNISEGPLTFNGTTIAQYASHEPQDQILWASDIAVVAAVLRSDASVVVGNIELSGLQGHYILTAALGNNITFTPEPKAFSSKTIVVNGVTKTLYARNHGIQQAVVTPGPTTASFVIPYPWVKIVGAEVIGGEALDYLNFSVYDTALGTYSGVPNYKLNQFGFSTNVAPGFYSRIAPYDADLYQGMVVSADYYSVSNKTVGINLILNEVKAS